MIEFLICSAALLLIFYFGQMGMKSGAFVALSRMLIAVVSLFVAMRYWFLVTRSAVELQPASVPVVALFVFWLLFVVTACIAIRVRDSLIENIESLFPSAFGRILGGAFGLISGIVIVSAVMMTLSIAAMQTSLGFHPASLPVRIDALPHTAYRFLERELAGVSETAPEHTPLPQLQVVAGEVPVTFWQ